MHILDLPPEILSNMLYFSLLNRGVRRALRLKLVCKSFYVAFTPILFHTKALDEAGHWRNFEHWHCRTYYGTETLWHDYLVFRCRGETNKSVGRFVEIREVAYALLQHCEELGEKFNLDLDTTLEGLCWLALERGTKYPGRREGWDSGTRLKPANPSLNLLSAGTYFGCISLVRDLLDQGCDPTQENDLFPAPMYLAAWTGRADMLQLMQEYLPDLEDPEPDKSWVNFRSKIGPPSLIGAAIRGDMDMVRLALYPPSRSIPLSDRDDNNDSEKTGEGRSKDTSSALILGVKPGCIRRGTKLWGYIYHGVRRARSPEVYQYLMSFLDSSEGDEDLNDKSHELSERAALGDIVMVRYLLELGADPAFGKANNGPAIYRAVRGFHSDIVDLLLERGADPNEPGNYNRRSLVAAAKAGSVAMVRKLLGAGAVLTKYKRDDGFTLLYAIKLEHTAMVELLLRSGVATEKGRRRLLEIARKEGLESMADLLRLWLVDEDGGSLPAKP